jgi:hypothetical protein
VGNSRTPKGPSTGAVLWAGELSTAGAITAVLVDRALGPVVIHAP